METDLLVDAIKYLRPTSQFSFINDDYSTIEWHVLEGDAPTLAEVKNAIEIVKKEQTELKAQAENKRAALLAKLGITEEEARLLIS